jgi:hypothetical protein
VNGRGSTETVYIDNQDRFLPHLDWVILAHELCGHALPGMQGNSGMASWAAWLCARLASTRY